MKKRLKFRAYKDSSAYDYSARDEDMQDGANTDSVVVPTLYAVSRRNRSLSWLGVALLLVFPLVVQYLPLGVRQYLAATVR